MLLGRCLLLVESAFHVVAQLADLLAAAVFLGSPLHPQVGDCGSSEYHHGDVDTGGGEGVGDHAQSGQ